METNELSFQETIDLMPVSIVVVNNDGSIVLVNTKFQKIFGFHPNEVIGKTVEILIPNRFREGHIIERLKYSEDPHERNMGKGLQLWGLKATGEEFPVDIGLNTCFLRGKQHAIASIADVTERMSLESQLIQSQRLESLGYLTSGIAHDMNNLLTAIGTISAIQLQFPQDEAKRLNAFQTIAKTVQRGSTSVASLLRLARKGKVEFGPVNLNSVVQEQVLVLGHTTLKSIAIDTALEDGLPDIEGDSSALAHALLNLCINAVDAMRNKIGNHLLTIVTKFNSEHVVVDVTDNGPGMSPEVLNHATEPFFTTKPIGMGTGLGLSLVNDVMKTHHGTLEIKSVEGKGTTIELKFPRLLQIPHFEKSKEMIVEYDRLDGKRALVVDDDDIVRNVISQMLQLTGMSVAEASRGGIALEVLMNGNQFDFVVLDMNMPGMGGEQTLKQIRLHFPELPVLVYTGLVDEHVTELVAQTNKALLLQKPFELRDIFSKVSSLLAKTTH